MKKTYNTLFGTMELFVCKQLEDPLPPNKSQPLLCAKDHYV